MRVYLKEKQVDNLAKFLMDISKGFVLALLGSVIIGSNINLVAVVIGGTFAIICLLEGLYLFGRI